MTKISKIKIVGLLVTAIIATILVFILMHYSELAHVEQTALKTHQPTSNMKLTPIGPSKPDTEITSIPTDKDPSIDYLNIPKFRSSNPSVVTSRDCYMLPNNKHGVTPGSQFFGGNSWNSTTQDLTVCAGAKGDEMFRGEIVVGGHVDVPGTFVPDYHYATYLSPSATGILYIDEVKGGVITLISKKGTYPKYTSVEGVSEGQVVVSDDHIYSFDLNKKEWKILK